MQAKKNPSKTDCRIFVIAEINRRQCNRSTISTAGILLGTHRPTISKCFLHHFSYKHINKQTKKE